MPRAATSMKTMKGFFMGRFIAGAPTYDLDGNVDEVRISNVACCADWIKAQYLSMTDSFITFGEREHWGIAYNLSGWGWCTNPTEIRDMTLEGWLLEEVTEHALEPTLHGVGNLTLTGTINDSYNLDMYGSGVRLLFYARPEAKGISANLGGIYQDIGNNTYYICSAGIFAIPNPEGQLLKTFRLCFF